MGNKAKILLLVGGAPYHDQTAHREALSGFLSPVFDVEMSGYPRSLAEETLAEYDVIVDYSSWWAPNRKQYRALLEAVAGGKGFVALHAGDTFMNSSAYHDMMGASFVYHDPKQTFKVEYREKTRFLTPEGRKMKWARVEHPITEGLEDFEVYDELFIVQGDMTRWRILCQSGGHPVAWTKVYGKGQVFCTVLGHDERSWNNPGVQALCVQGIQWAAGLR